MSGWIPVEKSVPTAKDADQFDRVWAVAVDATGRPYPCEAYWKHVAQGRPVYTHWMQPEWGIDVKQKRRM
jgi:hypothetical protein